MHLSKKALYLGIIAYSAAILIFQDWPAMTATVGSASAPWLGKMCLDVLFAIGALVRMAGPSLFASDEDDDEIALQEEDLHVSDTMLFGAFLINVAANGSFHAYQSIMTTDLASFYYSIWTMAEFVVLIVTFVLFSHTRKVQKRMARKAREAAKTAGSVSLNRAA